MATLVLAVHASLLWRFAVDWPVQDDFTLILATPGYLVQLQSWLERVALLTALELEHRAATVRLYGWLAAMLPGGMDFRLLIALGNGMLLGAGILVVAWFPRDRRPLAAMLAALLLLSSGHFAAQFHASGALQHFGVSFYALASLHFLASGHRLPVPMTLAAAATLTSASGLLVFPAAALLLALSRRPLEAAIWGSVGVVIVAVYFVGHKSPHVSGALTAIAAEPLHVTGLTLAALGCIGVVVPVAIGIGAAAVFAWAALAMTGALHRVPPVVIAAAVLMALTCAMVAVGRATLDIESVMLSRYRSYSGLFVLLTFAALAWALRGRASRVAGAAAIAGTVALYVHAWGAHVPMIVQLGMMQSALRDHFAADGHGHYDTYPQEFGDFTLNRARAIGSFNGSRKALPPVALVPGRPPGGGRGLTMDVDVYPGRRVTSVAGWILGAHDGVELWIDDGQQAYRAPVEALHYPAGLTSGPRTAFHATVDLLQVAPGRYRLGFATRTGRQWTRHAVTVAQ